MDINFDKIKQDYPEAYNKFLKKIIFDKTKYKFKEAESLEYFENVFLKTICYCNLVDFFENLGIMIFIEPEFYFDKSLHFKGYCYRILQEKNITLSNRYNTRPEAKQQAIYKAFEILNKSFDKIDKMLDDKVKDK